MNSVTSTVVRRLFSTFADGLPGAGLLILRFFVGGALIIDAMGAEYHGPTAIALAHLLGAVAGMFLFIGLWTPIAGACVALVELCLVAVVPQEHLRSHVLQAAFGTALAMIGPGLWSVDARLYGWKRLKIPTRKG